MNKLSRNAERSIGLGLVVAAAVGGYAAHGSNNNPTITKNNVVAANKATPGSQAEIVPGQTKITITPKASPSISPTPTPSESQKPRTKSEMQPPLTPTGGDYNLAEDAAYQAKEGDFDTARKEFAKITNPAVKAVANHAIQVAYAENAAFNISNAEDYTAAKSLEAQITDPSLIAKVELTINQEMSGDTTGANSTWDDLYALESSEWDNLYHHSDGYVQLYNQAPDN